MILRDSALLLTEAVTKFNRLVKYLAINGGGCFYLRRRSGNARLQKLIYGGGHLKTTVSKNNVFLEAINTFLEAGLLYGLPPKIVAQTAHTSARYHTHHIYRAS
jgi:hypothetical protein